MEIGEIMLSPGTAAEGATIPQEGGNGEDFLAFLRSVVQGNGSGGAGLAEGAPDEGVLKGEAWDLESAATVAGAMLGGLLFSESSGLNVDVPLTTAPEGENGDPFGRHLHRGGDAGGWLRDRGPSSVAGPVHEVRDRVAPT